MTDVTAHLALPFLAVGQAQKEMSHNEALARIDVLIGSAAQGVGIEAPPSDPEPGQCWIVGGDPEGAWAEHPHALAGWTEGGWRFVDPCEGMRVWLGEGNGFAVFSGGEWIVGRVFGRLHVGGEQVVGPRGAAIAEPTGGVVVDAEARAAIGAVLLAMREHGLIESD